LWTVFTSALGIYVVVILTTRLNGLRTFSKMSSFDFAITVATGSVIGSTALSDSATVLEGGVAVASLIGLQRIIAWARVHWKGFGIVDNEPIVLMAGDRIFDDALARARVTRADLYAKLREANVLRLPEVQVVVMETTGDISVLHGEERIDPELLEGVDGTERVQMPLTGSS
jgi:uncharacterized membrane protein YcaP (DUF421 family)